MMNGWYFCPDCQTRYDVLDEDLVDFVVRHRDTCDPQPDLALYPRPEI